MKSIIRKSLAVLIASLVSVTLLAQPAHSNPGRPAITSASLAADGVTLTFVLSEAVQASTGNAAEWDILVNGTRRANSGVSVSNSSAGDTTIVLTLQTPVFQSATVEYRYRGSGNYRNISGASPMDLFSMERPVTNNSTVPEPIRPGISSASLASNGVTLTFALTAAVSASTGNPAHWDIIVNGAARISNTGFSVANSLAGHTAIVLTLQTPVPQSATVTYRYTGSGNYSNTSGTMPMDFFLTPRTVTNNSTVQPDNTPPGLVTFGVPNPTSTTAQFIVEFTETASFTWVVLPATSAPPTSTAVRNRSAAGRVADGTGSFTGTLVVGNITSLTSGTNYVLYVVAVDPSNNVSAVFPQPFSTTGSAPVVLSLVSSPTLALNGDTVASTAAVWSTGTPTQLILACTQSSSAASGAQSSAPSFVVNSCARLWTSTSVMGIPTDLSTAFIDQGDIPGQPNLKVPFSQWSSTYRHIVRYDFVTVAPNTRYVWSATREYLPISNVSATSSESGTAEMEQAPVLFGGPKIASFVKAAASTPSNQLQFVGKRMNKVTSASVGGLQATISVTRSTLSITVPEGLAPGIYNLVLESTDGRITIMRFVTVR